VQSPSLNSIAPLKKSVNQVKTEYTTNPTQNGNDVLLTNMKLMFEQFDKDNDGRITKHELNFVMCNLFPEETITEQDINEMLKAADLDNNGFIDFDGQSK
jgi:hypothetical protein